MIELIRQASMECGIISIISNSKERIETQLNALTRQEDTPTFLISWDIVTNLNFDENGFLENPLSSITGLLMKKSSDLTKDQMEIAAQEMGALFSTFIVKLYSKLIPFQTSNRAPITGANYQLLPKYGAGHHSGVLCKWTMRTQISNC